VVLLAALPRSSDARYLFSGLRITASASVGAITVEWIGSDTGLGYTVINSTYQFNIAGGLIGAGAGRLRPGGAGPAPAHSLELAVRSGSAALTRGRRRFRARIAG
jgi:hypothetical protein